MTSGYLYKQAGSYLSVLCTDISDRSVGSEGNKKATRFFKNVLASLGWKTTEREFDAIDWKENGATLKAFKALKPEDEEEQQEQLMPKNFVFYNPPEHKKIVSLLENSGAGALLCATGRNAALSGNSERIPAKGYNVRDQREKP